LLITGGSLAKPKLIPLAVPWKIADSNSELTLIAREKDAVAEIHFNGLQLPNTYSDPFGWGAPRRIVATFVTSNYAKIRAAESDFDTIDVTEYDWSAVFPPHLLKILSPYHELMDIEGWDIGYLQWQHEWVEKGIVGNPNAYTVLNSPLVHPPENSIPNEFWHYLFVGEYHFIELTARSMSWRFMDDVESNLR
jgi:hypothetical protein